MVPLSNMKLFVSVMRIRCLLVEAGKDSDGNPIIFIILGNMILELEGFCHSTLRKIRNFSKILSTTQFLS